MTSPAVHGVRPGEVLAAIRQRAEGGGEEDGRRIVLLVEGGAMRGAYSIGGLIGLESLGFGAVFDEVYGGSAGALNAAYFLAGQAAYGSSVYYEDATDLRFINPLRLRKICDVDYLFDRILGAVKPLNVPAVLGGRSRLLVALAESASGRLFLQDASQSPVPLMTLLKASSAMPVLYQRTVAIGSRLCVDGCFPVAIPFHEALTRGATHILVLLTQPASFREPPPSALQRWLFARLYSRGSQPFAETFNRSPERSNAVREMVLGVSPSNTGAAIATFCPEAGSEALERTTTSPSRLRAGIEEMNQKVRAAFAA